MDRAAILPKITVLQFAESCSTDEYTQLYELVPRLYRAVGLTLNVPDGALNC